MHGSGTPFTNSLITHTLCTLHTLPPTPYTNHTLHPTPYTLHKPAESPTFCVPSLLFRQPNLEVQAVAKEALFQHVPCVWCVFQHVRVWCVSRNIGSLCGTVFEAQKHGLYSCYVPCVWGTFLFKRVC
jgi:hypothetical protein